MKKKIMTIATKMAGFALALTISLGVPATVAHAAHPSGTNHHQDHNYFYIFDSPYHHSRSLMIEYKYGRPEVYNSVFITYYNNVLEIYEWTTGRRIAVIGDAVLRGTIIEY